MAAASRPGNGLDADQRRRMRALTLTLVVMAAGIALAAVAYFWWELPWLTIALLVLCVPLRWVATLMVDADPRAQRRRRGGPTDMHHPL